MKTAGTTMATYSYKNSMQFVPSEFHINDVVLFNHINVFNVCVSE